MVTFRLLPFLRADGATQMATDAALLAAVRAGREPPTLRFYQFTPPCLSLGYFQRATRGLDLGACAARGVDVVRRPTGGRAVLHHLDLTYAVIAPESALGARGVIGVYRVICDALVAGLRAMGVPAECAPARRRPGGSANCFASASAFEVLVEGKKICGSAQRRDGEVVLQHGSILLDIDVNAYRAIFGDSATWDQVTWARAHAPDVDAPTLMAALATAAARTWNVRLSPRDLPREERQRGEAAQPTGP